MSRLVQEPDLRLDCNDSYATTTNKKNFTSRTNLTHTDDRLRFTLPTISLFSFSLFFVQKGNKKLKENLKTI